MSYAFGSLDELGDGYGFRKIRKALGVEAFGVNAIVYPPRYEGPAHYHDTQDELYFVHKGRIRVDVEGESRELGEGGLFHASSTTPRRISNAGDEDAVCLRRRRQGRLRRAGRSPRERGGSTCRARQGLAREGRRSGSRRPRRCAAVARAPRRARSCSSRSGRGRCRPSSAACARNGKSSRGIVSPPCVTAMVIFGLKTSARGLCRASCPGHGIPTSVAVPA